MDQVGDNFGDQGAAEGKRGASVGGDSMAAPLPPVFGNANTNRIGGEGDFRGINLDDIFSGVFFTPDGELLDIPSDEDVGLNVTLSSTSSSEGRAQPPFMQYAVMGDSPNATGDGGGSGNVGDVFMSPARVKREKIPKILHEGKPGGTGGSADAGLFEAQAAVGVGGVLGGGVEIGATGAAEEATGVLTMQPKSEYPPAGRCSAAEATGGTAGAGAAAVASETRATRDAEISKAAAKATEPHAQVQMRLPARGAGTEENSSLYPRPASAASDPLAALPTGGIMGPLAAHGLQTSSPLHAGGPLGRSEGGTGGIRGITAVAPPNASVLAGGPRGRGVYAGALPRRQRHKVSSKDLTEEQRIERRERNREHAKRSRVRKKFLLDSLQRSVDALQAENDSLKGSIVGSLGERGRDLVAKCSPEDAGGTLVTANPTQATKILDDPDYSLVKALQTAQQNFVITDASLPDNPIVFASSGFLDLTRYKLNEVLGRNCRFLQGPETDPRAVDKIRTAIEEGYDTSVCLLNYRADGTTFWNQFFVAALRDGVGATVNYVGVQCKVGDDYARIVVTAQNKQLASSSASTAAAGAGAAAPRRGAQSSRSQPSSNPATPGTAPASAAAAPSAAAGAGARRGGAQI